MILPARCANQMAMAQTRKCSAVCEGQMGGPGRSVWRRRERAAGSCRRQRRGARSPPSPAAPCPHHRAHQGGGKVVAKGLHQQLVDEDDEHGGAHVARPGPDVGKHLAAGRLHLGDGRGARPHGCGLTPVLPPPVCRGWGPPPPRCWLLWAPRVAGQHGQAAGAAPALVAQLNSRRAQARSCTGCAQAGGYNAKEECGKRQRYHPSLSCRRAAHAAASCGAAALPDSRTPTTHVPAHTGGAPPRHTHLKLQRFRLARSGAGT